MKMKEIGLRGARVPSAFSLASANGFEIRLDTALAVVCTVCFQDHLVSLPSIGNQLILKFMVKQSNGLFFTVFF